MAKTKRKRFVPLTDEHLNSPPLHQLCKIALVDARKQEQAKDSELCMNVYYRRNGVCRTCFAGSVARFSCRMPRKRFTHDGYFMGHTPNWAIALDFLRRGRIWRALVELGRTGDAIRLERLGQTNVRVASYEIAPEQWWRDMQRVYEILKEYGV